MSILNVALLDRVSSIECLASADSEISFENIKHSIRDNVENILNTILYEGEIFNHEHKGTIVDYGLAPLNSMSLDINDSNYICNRVKERIKLFEPRLKFIAVEMIQENKTNNLQMMVSGILECNSHEYQVSYLSTYQHSKDSFSLRQEV